MPNYRAMARRAARRHGLDPNIFERQIQQESGFQTGRSSGKGAQGIAQIMPDTARGWGVDPNNPKQALDAAAKHMAGYVKQFGGYENALRAYNAGPGAVQRSKGFAETNHYVATILNGKDPKRLGTPRGGGGSSGGGSSTTTTKLGGPGSAVNIAAALTQQSQRPQHSITAPALPDVLTPQGYTPVVTQAPAESPDLKSALAQVAQDKLPSITTSTTTTSGGGGGGGGGGVPKSGSQIKELFWQGKGGIDIKDGKRVPQGFVSGHTDHVHVAAGPKTTVRLGKLAQRMGLHVGENPRFGGVHPVHVQGSNHYKGEAIDVSGDPELMRKFAKRVARYSRQHG